MSDRLGRLVTLTGVLFAALVLVAFFIGSESPGSNESSAKIASYYETHSSEVKASAIIFGLAFLVLVVFAAVLRSYLRRTPAAEGTSALLLAGSILIAAGAMIGSGVEFGLAKEVHHLGPESIKTLNFINEEAPFLPIVAGAFLFAIGAGLSILRGAALPRWLGWVAIVLGIAAIIPPVSLVSLVGFALWSLIVSIVMYRRSAPAQAGAPPAASGAGAVAAG